jgi:plasmid stabilization system protein ParE
MQLEWTRAALADLSRLHEFQARVNATAAARLIKGLTTAAERLLAQPRIGETVSGFDPREVRRMLAGKYEIRYEIVGYRLIVLRIWHTREDR